VSSSSTETFVDVTMPQMGVSVAEGTVVEWRKQVGDWVEADEIIAAISTDKIDTDVESPASGRVQEILVEVGTTVDVGTVLARIATDARPGEAHKSETPETGTGEATAALEAPNEAGELAGDEPRPRRYSPVVMRIAAEHHVDLDKVPATGRGGRVRKQDVLAYIDQAGGGSPTGDSLPSSADAELAASVDEPPMHIESPYKPEAPPPPKKREPRFAGPEPAPAPAASPPEAAPTGAPLSRMRQAIGQRMLESLRTAATCTTIAEADMSRIEAARSKSGFTYLPYIARATIDTLRELPALNATLEGESLTTHDAVHLGIAVSLGEGGLIVPVIRDAQDLSVEGLARRIKDLAQRARANSLTPDEVRGGTFTITNPGGYGSIMATPVINQPQVAILDTEAVVKRPVVVTDELGNDSIAIRPMTFLCMSWDHRALDGALAAQFLAALRKQLEAW
jgi:pyruvate/2-oxoglutarate dehydrogenase complex dihydrolipoamide acyltransferase (E2) component